MKVFVYLAGLTAIAAIAMVFSRSAFAAALARVDLVGALALALVIVAGVAKWRSVSRRRERQKLDGMRDSALW